MKLLHAGLVAALGLAAAGCATDRLEPAPAANQLAGSDQGAIAAENGIRIVARAGAWDRTPQNLDAYLTPILVTLTNTSQEPVRIAYNKLRLVSDKGRRFSAVPPFRIDGQVPTITAGSPFYTPVGFGYAPYFSPYFPGAITMPFETNGLYWNRYAPLLDTVKLPTPDMLRAALPEGVLQPGGRVQGFVYFEGVGSNVDRVRLIAEFDQSKNGQGFARLSIPFEVG